jgi:uncharacterized protein YdhG (YjbR/CyaY superfamily)
MDDTNDSEKQQRIQTKNEKITEVEKYILQFEPKIKVKLDVLRKLFFKVLPDNEESIRYKIPVFKVVNYHLYFAAYKKHNGFYPIYGFT